MGLPKDAEVILWTRNGCGACVRAKQFLSRKQVEFVEKRLKNDPVVQQAFSRATGGARSVPQFIIGGQHIGGLDDVLQLEKTGELDVLLGRADTMPSLTPFKRFLRWFGL
jgi:glutaredoxin 3